MKKKNRAVMMMMGICLMAFLSLGCPNPGGGDPDPGGSGGGGSDLVLPAPESTGSFTLNGADAYNGQYAVVVAELPGGTTLLGATAATWEGVFTGVQITGGTVTLPVYEANEPTRSVQAYTKTENVSNLTVYLMSSAPCNMSTLPDATPVVVFTSVSFTAGIGAGNVSGGFVSTAGESGGGGSEVVLTLPAPESTGSFTLNGIDSSYNGKYAFIMAYSLWDTTLYGMTGLTLSGSNMIFTGVPIAGGTVTIPLYLSAQAYTETESVFNLTVYLVDSASCNMSTLPDATPVVVFTSANFTAGIGAESVSGGFAGETSGGASEIVLTLPPPASTGSFTLTAASAYNGKYAFIMANNLWGTTGLNVSGSNRILTGVPIAGGTVTIPLYLSFQAYTETEAVSKFFVVVWDSPSYNLNFPMPTWTPIVFFDSVSFSSGTATKSVDDADYRGAIISAPF
jgi:hypothetical protein